ncbi:MAG: SpoIID/LytB domain-containing protein [Planctomycetes bacterium]|nr:SpoIID/LytB domain-containing protein [Planctomycetota bacterium]
MCGFVSCTPSAVVLPENPAEPKPPTRNVRVLLIQNAERVRVDCPGPITATDASGARVNACPPGTSVWIDSSPDEGLLICRKPVASPQIVLHPGPGDYLRVQVEPPDPVRPATLYSGNLHVSTAHDGRINVTNLVDVETYVTGVVAEEVWPTFADEALRVQAIAARTYVLCQMERRASDPYDVSATQSSQVYRGIRHDLVGRRALEATRYTRGLVGTWHDGQTDRLFPTYYSAACGGVSQSAAIFGKTDDIPPLAGGVKCDYCRIAPGQSYRWGPVRLQPEEAFARLLARYPDLESLRWIDDITVTDRTASGRPMWLRLHGAEGQTHDILAERFRLALGGHTIRSTDCDITVTRSHWIFENGKGFGHGLGLCQWGTQGQALAGRSAAQILRYYYPGSKITRVY